MHAHTNVCDSGDNTIEAAKKAIREIVEKESDDYFIFLVSDANMESYGITPETFGSLYSMDSRVKMFSIFIASSYS